MTILSARNLQMRPLEPDTARAVLRQINRQFEPRPLPRATTTLTWAPLPFYADMLLYACRDSATIPAITKYVLRRRHQVFVLDYTAAPILAANAAAPLQLDIKTVADYARFFTSFVWHKNQPQFLVERVEDIPAAADLSDEKKMILGQVLRPLRVHASADFENAFEIDACFISGRELVSRRLLILEDGQMRCSPDQRLMEDASLMMESGMR